MKHEERRREAGKMFIDISKYFFILGLVGVIFSDKITVVTVIALIIIAIICFIIGIITLPPKNQKT